jgi:hypothetical protein
VQLRIETKRLLNRANFLPACIVEFAHSMPHVMISYNWDHQALVLEFGEFLKSRGVDVWIDVQGSSCLGKMAGSTDEMMIKVCSGDAVCIL